jgi:hypothetical protein
MTDTTQPVKKPRGRNGGRTVGAKNTVTSENILKEIALQTGRPFPRLLAEGYHASIIACDVNARLQYEKLILSKVIADKHTMDVTSGGQSLVNSFNFTRSELPEWQTPQLKIINATSK